MLEPEVMDRAATALVRRISRVVMASAGRLSRPVALTVIAVVTAAFLWVVTVAPLFVAVVLTIGLAIAWCVWLERHPE
jgi:hypothetical protein